MDSAKAANGTSGNCLDKVRRYIVRGCLPLVMRSGGQEICPPDRP